MVGDEWGSNSHAGPVPCWLRKLSRKWMKQFRLMAVIEKEPKILSYQFKRMGPFDWG